MHGTADQIRIMNESNVRLIQHLTTNNPLPPLTVPILEVQHLVAFNVRVMINPKAIKVQAGHIRTKIGNVDHQVPILDKKALPPYQNPDHPVGLLEWKARKSD